MMSDDKLRQQIKLLKALGAIKSYHEIAKLLQISRNGFYNWLNGYYNLSYSKKSNLIKFINGRMKRNEEITGYILESAKRKNGS